MAGSIGQVYYDVLPNLDGFAAKVASGVGSSAKPLKIKVDADTAKASAGIKGLSTQTAGLDAVGRRLLSTQGTLRVATARLAEVRQKAAAGSARLISAEESHARATRAVAAAQEAAAAQAGQAQTRFGKLTKTLGGPEVQNFGRGMAVAGVAIGAGLGYAVKVSADFEQAVSHVAATSKDAKTNIGQLRSEAIKYGASTSFSAKEAANAQEELIKANVSVTDTIKGGLKGALDLAAAGSLGVADAAGIMATTMSQFKVPGTEASHVADLLAAAAGKAQGEVGDFAGALKYVGPVAHSSNVSLEETVGTLALLADGGVKGEMAGTSLRSMLVSLTAPLGVGAKAIDKYGINLRDASGEFIGMEAAAGELQAKLGGLGKAERDAALARIFGKNSITAATLLYEAGAEGVRKWTDGVNDSGFASEVARTKMDNLKGDVEKLGGAFQSAFIDTAASSTGGLRGIVQGITGLVDAYNALPSGGKSAAFAIAGVAAAALLAGGGVIKLVGVINNAKTALAGLEISAKSASIAAGGIGLALTAGVAIIGHFAIKQAEATARTNELTQALTASNGAVDQGVASIRARTLEESGALKSANALGISIADVTQASLGNVDAQARVNAQLEAQGAVIHAAGGGVDEYGRSTNELEADLINVGKAIGTGNKELNNATAAWKRTQEATDAVAGSTTGLSSESAHALGDLLAVSGAIEAVGTKSTVGAAGVKAMTDALYGQANAAAAAMDAEIGYQQALDDAQAAAKSNGKTLNIHTQEGRNNVRALEAMAGASQKLVTENLKQGGSWKDAVKDTKAARKSFIDVAESMGASAPKARKMADDLGLIPKDVRTAYKLAIKAEEAKKLEDLNTAIDKLPPEQQTLIRAKVDAGDLKGAQKLIDQFAKPHRAKVDIVVNRAAGNRAKREVKYFDGTRKTKVNVGTSGVPKSKHEVGSIKGKPTKVPVSTSGVPKSQKQVSGIRHKGVTVGVKSAGVPRTQGQVSGIKSKGVTVPVRSSGIGAVQSAINSIKGKVVDIITRIIKKADGGPIEGLAGGGRVYGPGGPRDDLITGINRATGNPSVMVSNGEFVTNAAQYAANKAQVEMINHGGKWDLTPRRGNGGGVGPVAQSTTAAHRPLTLVVNVDLGPELGGIRRIVTDAIDDDGEFTATLARMK